MVNHTQTKEIIIKKDTEIRLLEEKIIHLQQEIQYKDTHIQELTRSNTTLEGKISKVLLDISTSIHLN